MQKILLESLAESNSKELLIITKDFSLVKNIEFNSEVTILTSDIEEDFKNIYRTDSFFLENIAFLVISDESAYIIEDDGPIKRIDRKKALEFFDNLFFLSQLN